MHIHFMGIGGCGVSGLALMAMDRGYSVSGCDILSSGPYYKMVKEKGVPCYTGHSAGHLKDVDILVRSSAVPENDNEVSTAIEKGTKVYTRGEFLAKLLVNTPVIGVAGSHGKTTTAWMIYHILKKTGLEPSIYAGGKSGGITNINASDPVVVELDESDGTVFEVDPEILLINNLEFEDVDHFKSEEGMRMQFERYLMKRDKRRLIIGRGYDPGNSLCTLFDALSVPSLDEIREKSGYENTSNHHFSYYDDKWSMVFNSVEYFAGTIKDAPHILQNRFSAMLASSLYLNLQGMEMPMMDNAFWRSIPEIDRRFQVSGTYGGVVLVDDYAHHPTEIAATVQQAEIEYKNFGLVFQPHKYTRFNAFYDSFKKVLTIPGPLIILPVYSAGEKEEGVNSLDLYNDLKETGYSEVYYFPSIEEAGIFLKNNMEKLRISALVCVGAGDLNSIFSYLKREQS